MYIYTYGTRKTSGLLVILSKTIEPLDLLRENLVRSILKEEEKKNEVHTIENDYLLGKAISRSKKRNENSHR